MSATGQITAGNITLTGSGNVLVVSDGNMVLAKELFVAGNIFANASNITSGNLTVGNITSTGGGKILQGFTTISGSTLVASTLNTGIISASGNIETTGNIGTLTGVIDSRGGGFKSNQRTVAQGTTGTAGQIFWDADYIYVCTAANTWKRAALSTY
jgi:hypothetical protein